MIERSNALETEKKTEEVKPQKRRLIRIEGLTGHSSNVYGLTSFNFAFVSAPIQGVRHQATANMTCREYVNKSAWLSFNKENGAQFNPKDGHFVDFDCLRILFVYSPSDVRLFKERLFNGKAALNVLERLAGWEQSKITTVVHNNYKNAWLLTGPKEWMSQPQLVSLMTWIMRLSSFQTIEVTNFDTLEASLYSISKGSGSTDASTYAKVFWDKVYIILKYHKEIFGDIPLKEAWSSKLDENCFGNYSGLLTFVHKNARYSDKIKVASDKYGILCRERLPRKNDVLYERINK